jgi:hypothetical protein
MNLEEPTAEQFREWINIPNPFGTCTKGATRDLRHKVNTAEHIVVRGGCNAWGCPICGPRKRFRFARHYAGKLIADGRPVCEEVIPTAKWNAFRKRLHRGNGRYLRISQDDGWIVLYVADNPTCGSTMGTPGAISRRVGQIFRTLDDPAGKFTASDEWGLRRGPSEYKLAGLVPYKKAEELTQELIAKGIPMRELPARQSAEWVIAYREPSPVELVYKDGVFTVVSETSASVSHCSVHQVIGVRHNGTCEPNPVFSVALGADGPELVVGPAARGDLVA